MAKLKHGHNAAYWVAKVKSNVRRDREKDAVLRAEGWLVVRCWSTDVEVRSGEIASAIATAVRERSLKKAGLVGQG